MRYYENYKKISKILSKRKAESEFSKLITKDPITAVLEETEKLKVMPRCLGLVKTRG